MRRRRCSRRGSPAPTSGASTSSTDGRMIKENEGRFQKAMAKDFKTASQEYIFETQASAGEAELQKSQLKEWMKPASARGVAAIRAIRGHRRSPARCTIGRPRPSRPK